VQEIVKREKVVYVQFGISINTPLFAAGYLNAVPEKENWHDKK